MKRQNEFQLSFRKTVAFVFLVASLCYAQQTRTKSVWTHEPKNFRDVPFGATQQETELALLLRCYGSICSGPFVLADGVKAENTFEFEQNKLTRVMLKFKSDQFDLIRDEFIKLYGQEHRFKKKTVQNRMGDEFINETLTWEGKNVSIVLSKYVSNINESIAVIALNETFGDALR